MGNGTPSANTALTAVGQCQGSLVWNPDFNPNLLAFDLTRGGVVPAAGTGDHLTNPTRVAPRHLVDLGIGTDNLLRGERAKLRLQLSVINLTNRQALYNFLSTFSGTHFVTPRAYQLQMGVAF